MAQTHALSPVLVAALSADVAETLAGIFGQPSVPGGYNILRWFLNGWVVHSDAAVQADLEGFADAHNPDGTLVLEASAKGYTILRAAVAGHLVSPLEG